MVALKGDHIVDNLQESLRIPLVSNEEVVPDSSPSSPVDEQDALLGREDVNTIEEEVNNVGEELSDIEKDSVLIPP